MTISRVLMVVPFLLSASALCAQEESEHPVATGADWPDKVRVAIEHPRYQVQRAASNEVARAGDAAVPAIRAYSESKGKDAIPLLLVDAIAEGNADGDALRALLRQWASDRTFFWRAQALTGLAKRRSAADAALFAQALADPSHLFRVAGAKGVHALAFADKKPWDTARAVLADKDPRARVMFALHLWNETIEQAALKVLVGALADDRAFLDDDWARRLALQSVQALARVATTNFGYQGTKSLAGNAEAIDKFAKWANLAPPPRHERDTVADVAGVEIRSCRFGDLFVRLTDAEVHFDLDRGRQATLPAPAHAELLAGLRNATADGDARAVLGKVVCDYTQVTLRQPHRLWKIAPDAMPQALHAVLAQLATALAANQQESLAAEVRERLVQFPAKD